MLPIRKRGDLRLGHPALACHLQMLRPLVLRAHQLRTAQDDELAQRTRGARVMAQRLGELRPGGNELWVVAERLVEIRRLAPELDQAFAQGGLELGEGNAWHGAHNSPV